MGNQQSCFAGEVELQARDFVYRFQQELAYRGCCKIWQDELKGRAENGMEWEMDVEFSRGEWIKEEIEMGFDEFGDITIPEGVQMQILKELKLDVFLVSALEADLEAWIDAHLDVELNDNDTAAAAVAAVNSGLC